MSKPEYTESMLAPLRASFHAKQAGRAAINQALRELESRPAERE